MTYWIKCKTSLGGYADGDSVHAGLVRIGCIDNVEAVREQARYDFCNVYHTTNLISSGSGLIEAFPYVPILVRHDNDGLPVQLEVQYLIATQGTAITMRTTLHPRWGYGSSSVDQYYEQSITKASSVPGWTTALKITPDSYASYEHPPLLSDGDGACSPLMFWLGSFLSTPSVSVYMQGIRVYEELRGVT